MTTTSYVPTSRTLLTENSFAMTENGRVSLFRERVYSAFRPMSLSETVRLTSIVPVFVDFKIMWYLSLLLNSKRTCMYVLATCWATKTKLVTNHAYIDIY